jgi:hypothetical protein
MVNNNSIIETVRDTADNLYHLLDLIFSQFKEMEPGQTELYRSEFRIGLSDFFMG